MWCLTCRNNKRYNNDIILNILSISSSESSAETGMLKTKMKEDGMNNNKVEFIFCHYCFFINQCGFSFEWRRKTSCVTLWRISVWEVSNGRFVCVWEVFQKYKICQRDFYFLISYFFRNEHFLRGANEKKKFFFF